jgi:hypothetical protein
VTLAVGPLVAHGIGGRTDLPLSVWMFGYGAAAALVVSFAALSVFWPEPRLEASAPAGATTVSPPPTSRAIGGIVVRVLGVALFVLVLAAATFGDTAPTANLAPVAIYVLFWVGLTVVSAFVIDVWNGGLDPYPTFAAGLLPDQEDEARRPYTLGHWPAAAGILAFVWIELVLPSRAEPRVLAVLIVVYTAVVLAGAAVWGRPWLREGDPFAAWYGLLGNMAPLGPHGRPRRPLVGLAGLVPKPGTVALVLVALGSTAFDGLTRSSLWTDLAGNRSNDRLMVLSTVGLVWCIGVVAVLYFGAMKVASGFTGRPTAELADAFVHSLVPIAVAYAIAHYFSLLVLEGQGAIALASDPFGFGWDLFGTASRSIDYTLVSPNTIAYVQVASIVAGHVTGVVLAHDRALARFPKDVATKSQYPLLVTMVLFTVGGLGLLLGG